MTNKELARHCANVLELTTTTLPYEFQVELLRRFVQYAEPNGHPDDDLTALQIRRVPDPEAD